MKRPSLLQLLLPSSGSRGFSLCFGNVTLHKAFLTLIETSAKILLS
jgi:hypothetical protein